METLTYTLFVTSIFAALAVTAYLSSENQKLNKRLHLYEGPADDNTVAMLRTEGKTLVVELRMPFFTKRNRIVVVSPYGKRHEIRMRPKKSGWNRKAISRRP